MSRNAFLVAFSVLLLTPGLLPAAAGEAAAQSARYVLGAGLPGPEHFGLVCSPAIRTVDPDGAWVGGACFTIASGNRTITVTGDLGDSPEYWWFTLNHDASPAQCAEGRASGTIVIEVPEGCTELDVIPLAGSPAGTIEVG